MTMKESAQTANIAKMGAAVAILLVAAIITLTVILSGLSDANSRTEVIDFLNDVVDKRALALVDGWLGAFVALLSAGLFVALRDSLRRWGEDRMHIALLAGVGAAAFLAFANASVIVYAASIIPSWAAAGDDVTRAIIASDAQNLGWLIDATFTMFRVLLAIGILVASLVMLRLDWLLWRAVAVAGILGALVGFAAAFEIASESLFVAVIIHQILAIIWLLGVAIGLWRMPMSEQAKA